MRGVEHMLFKLNESVDVLEEQSCHIGDLVLVSKDGLKGLIFMGAEHKTENIWRTNFLLTRRYEEKEEEYKSFIVNSDMYVGYNGQISIDIELGEKVQFEQSLGYYVMEEYEKGVLKKEIDTKHHFYKATAIKLNQIKKDTIKFDIIF